MPTSLTALQILRLLDVLAVNGSPGLTRNMPLLVTNSSDAEEHNTSSSGEHGFNEKLPALFVVGVLAAWCYLVESQHWHARTRPST